MFFKIFQLQKYLTEQVLDQLEPLLEFRRWLACLNVTAQTPVAQKPVSVEMIPEVSQKIYQKLRSSAKIAKKILSCADKVINCEKV